MTGFQEVAAGGSGGPDIVLSGDMAHEPMVRLDLGDWSDVTAADELTPEGQFPEFGRFIPVRRYNGEGFDEEPVWWELSTGLAQMVEEKVESAGGYGEVVPADVTVDLDFVGKSDSGEWRFVGKVVVDEG